MATKAIQEIEKKADRIHTLRKLLAEKAEIYRKEIESLELELEVTENQIIKDLKKTGIESTRLTSGDLVTIIHRSGVNITNEPIAFQWAIDNKAVSINKRIVGQIMKEMKDIPAGFEAVDSEYVLVTKPKKK